MSRLVDDNGVVWNKVLTSKALQRFSEGHTVLIAEVNKDCVILNDNWVKTRRGKAEVWHAPHFFETPRFGHACHHVRDSRGSGNVYTYIERK